MGSDFYLFFLFQVLIQNKKIDLSHVTSKCGSLDNIHHRPGNSQLVLIYRGDNGEVEVREQCCQQVPVAVSNPAIGIYMRI